MINSLLLVQHNGNLQAIRVAGNILRDYLQCYKVLLVTTQLVGLWLARWNEKRNKSSR